MFLALRLLEPADEASLRAFFLRNSDPETVRYFHPFPLTEETASRLAAYEGGDRYYVAERSGVVIGLSMLRGWDDGYVAPSFGILVDRDWRGRSIGSRLTDFTLCEARSLGATSVRLSVYASHRVALELYSDRGFVEESREKVKTTSGDDFIVVMVKTYDQ